MSVPVAPEHRSKLLPYQEAFIEQFFDDSSVRAHLLRSEPGLGTSYTTAHLVQRASVMMPGARVLILAPKVLQAPMKDLLSGNCRQPLHPVHNLNGTRLIKIEIKGRQRNPKQDRFNQPNLLTLLPYKAALKIRGEI